MDKKWSGKTSKCQLKKKKRHHYDRHVSCPSYPVCDDAPLGCLVIQGIKNVEWYGHKG